MNTVINIINRVIKDRENSKHVDIIRYSVKKIMNSAKNAVMRTVNMVNTMIRH